VANEQLVVVDAAGTVLGALVNAGAAYTSFTSIGEMGPGTIVLDVEGLPLLPVHVRRNVLAGTYPDVYFASSDCTGTPLFFINGNSQDYRAPILPLTLVPSGGTIFYSDADAAPQNVVVHSRMDWRGECGYLATPGSFTGVPGFRASIQPFRPPYAVATRGELASP
jgi:hypothetical protein